MSLVTRIPRVLYQFIDISHPKSAYEAVKSCAVTNVPGDDLCIHCTFCCVFLLESCAELYHFLSPENSTINVSVAQRVDQVIVITHAVTEKSAVSEK